MMHLLGKTVAVVRSSDPTIVGLRGTLALESMHMITITTPDRSVRVSKTGTVLQVEKTGVLVSADDMRGRIEDRLSRGSRL